MRSTEFAIAVECLLEDLNDRYDGCPDSKTLWMGRHIDTLTRLNDSMTVQECKAVAANRLMESQPEFNGDVSVHYEEYALPGSDAFGEWKIFTHERNRPIELFTGDTPQEALSRMVRHYEPVGFDPIAMGA